MKDLLAALWPAIELIIRALAEAVWQTATVSTATDSTVDPALKARLENKIRETTSSPQRRGGR